MGYMGYTNLKMSSDFNTFNSIISRDIAKDRSLSEFKGKQLNLIDLVYLLIKCKNISDEDGEEIDFVDNIKLVSDNPFIIDLLLSTYRYLRDTVIMMPVESSNIREIGYNQHKKELYVRFKSGSQYKYLNVNRDEFSKMISADSKGIFFNEEIKPVKNCEKL